MRKKLSLLFGAALLAAAAAPSCAGTRNAEKPLPASPAPAMPALLAQGADSGTAAKSAGEELPPLSAGSDGGFPANAADARPSACAADTIRRTLEEVVAQCRREGQRVCGELKVRASEDGKSIRVALDIAKDSFDDTFSRCITSRLNGVAWRCTLPGSDTTLDLGCDL